MIHGSGCDNPREIKRILGWGGPVCGERTYAKRSTPFRRQLAFRSDTANGIDARDQPEERGAKVVFTWKIKRYDDV